MGIFAEGTQVTVWVNGAQTSSGRIVGRITGGIDGNRYVILDDATGTRGEHPQEWVRPCQAYSEGLEACKATTGPDRPHNPHPVGSADADQWERGFSDGEFGW